MKYKNYQRNHVIVKGQEKALEEFLNSTTLINGKQQKHKLRHYCSSNSEDALTWSCFDTLRNYKPENLRDALNEIMEDSFEGNSPFDFNKEKNIKVEIGKEYTAPSFLNKKEKTEVDTSIETDDKLIFIEAKLYSLISLPTAIQPYNQIARKIRVGLDYALSNNKQFYFIFLDIAPLEKSSLRKSKAEAEAATYTFADKWKSAWWFNYYRNKRSLKPLKDILADLTTNEEELKQVQQNMGWLTWASLFKTVLRATIK
ncbi:hypothetical protein [Aequorivita sinensis]|uniref:hypothetical protein n=1 Tax=Aequorivita sinensis TaxID=1382458 RepID=UPI0011238192|nr:hypothetical protein [Aequorivita sinensis]